MASYTEQPSGCNTSIALHRVDADDRDAPRERATRKLAQRFALSLAVASVIAQMAGVGPREAA